MKEVDILSVNIIIYLCIYFECIRFFFGLLNYKFFFFEIRLNYKFNPIFFRDKSHYLIA